MLETFQTLPTEPPFVINAPSLDYFEVQGDKGLRFRVSPGQEKDENGRCRTELRLRDPASKARNFLVDPDGVTMWSAVEFFVSAKRWGKLDPNKVVIHQWHHIKGTSALGKEPPLQAFIWNANLYLRECHAMKGKDVSPRQDLYKAKLRFDVWNRLVTKTAWDVTGVKGCVQAWLNGQLICKYKGVTGYGFAPGVYESIGMYWPLPTPGLAHEMNFRLWQRETAEIAP